MIPRVFEHAVRAALTSWRHLSLDARVIATVGVANWLLLFANRKMVAATRDLPLWRLFSEPWYVVFLSACGALAVLYAVRDLRSGTRFTVRQRVRKECGAFQAAATPNAPLGKPRNTRELPDPLLTRISAFGFRPSTPGNTGELPDLLPTRMSVPR